jgi:hypothetical protein
MKNTTMTLALTVLLGSFAQISANEDVQTQLSAIKSASAIERPALIQAFKFKLKNMGEEQRIQAMHQIQEKMPELAQSIQDERVAQKINAIKNAEPAERVKLMNQFKLELAKMNQEERAEAITQMQKQMNKEQVRVQERVQNMQMDQMQKTNSMEQMNQRQGADQFAQEIINTGSQQTNPGFGQKQ